MKTSLTIAHIGPCSVPVLHQYGGAIERRMLELARAQARRGNVVTIYSADDRSGAIDVHGFTVKSVPCRFHGIARRFEFLGRVLREDSVTNADVLHFHSVPEAGVFAGKSRGRKILSYDYFIFGKGKQSPLYWLYRTALRRFDYLLPVSEYCKSLSTSYWKLSQDKVEKFYNGVNLDQFRPDARAGAAKRMSLGLGIDPVILYVGRLCEQKGTDLLIEAYPIIKKAVPNARLVVAGPAKRFGNLNSGDLVQRLLDSGGVYLGAVHEEDLNAIYNTCDIFVMPTRADEMFGMAAAEAQACGKPVVCSRHGGLTEVIARSSGRFFEVGSAESLAAEAVTLLQDHDLRSRMSILARENAKRFDWDALAEELNAIYANN